MHRGEFQRRRPLREALCLILGSILSLTWVIPASVFFVGRSSEHTVLLSSLDSPGTLRQHGSTRQLSNNGRPVTDAAAKGKCRAAMRKCRADARQGIRPKERKSSKVLIDSVVSISSKGGGGKSLLKPMKAPPCNVSRSPFSSMIPFYPHQALESELQKHDRWVVDSIAYMHAFDSGENEAYQPRIRSNFKPITLVVLTVNRLVPYLTVLMATLLRGHAPATLGKYVDLHIINIERRPCRCNYQFLSDLEEKLPFVTFHDWTGPYPEHTNITSPNRMYKSNQRLDYIRVLKICMEKRSDWCLIMEDDVAISANLVPKFMNLTADFNTTDLAVLALYVPYNDYWSGENSIRKDKYAKEKYDEDVKAMEYMDPDTIDGPSPRLRYRVEDLGKVTYGVVANAYPSAQLGKMVQHLSRDDSRTSNYTDVALMRDFVAENGLRKMGVNPSLVNHVGHYSEHKNDVNKINSLSAEERCHSRMFHAMSMDVRFQLDDGWEAGESPVQGGPESQ